MIITVDFETYYDKEYSLKKLTTEEYIRDSRFEVVGVSVKIAAEAATWFSGTMAEIYDYLHTLPFQDNYMLAHNCRFDGFILSDRFHISCKGYLDTLSMSRAINGVNVGGSLAYLAERYKIGQKGIEVLNAIGKHREDFSVHEFNEYANYCINDAELTFKLYKILAAKFPQSELRVIDLTLKMFIDPILCIDGGVLTEHIQNIRNRKEELLASSNVERTELMSNPKYAVLLENLGVSPPRKISKTTGKETFAFAKTDEGHKKLLEHPDIQVQTLVSARMGVKTTLEETRSERLLGISSRGLLPIPLKYYAAHTGRWGGDDKLNMQNLPARGSNKTIKDAILAPPGHTLINCDSSQIEARVIAWLAGQKDILSDFASGKDVYKQMATKIYQVDINHVTKEQRQVAKAVVLGCGFGMGPVRFKIQFKSDSGIDIPKAECEKIIRTYRRQCERITNLWKDGDSCLNAIIDDAEATFGVVPCIQFKPNLSGFILPNGLTQTYRGLTRKMEGKYVEFEYPTRNSVIGIYGGSLTENLVQAIARCIIAEQMIAISRRYRVVLTVHDAVLCCVPDEQAEAARAYMETCMCTNPEWATGLPLNCESTMGKSYGSCR